jgi:pteridine reductase
VNVDGKVGLVTGAGRRLGRAVALALGRAGADVVVHYGSSAEGAEETATTLRKVGRRAWTIGADLADPAAIAALFDRVGREIGGLDLLVNSAALFESQPVGDVTPEDWDRTMAVNLRAPFFCAQRAAALMPTAGEGGGAIVNVSDLSGVSPWPGYAVHGTSKAALIFLTLALARELGPAVRVNAVLPGPILPPPGVGDDDPDWLRRGDGLPLGRTGDPGDVAEAVLALLANDYVTGAVLPVDGGERLLGPR